MTEITFEMLNQHIDQALYSWSMCEESKEILSKVSSIEEFTQLPEAPQYILWYTDRYYNQFYHSNGTLPIIKLNEEVTNYIESILCTSKSAINILHYLQKKCNYLNTRDPKIEEFLLKSTIPESNAARVIYARCFIKGRWPEIEPLIINDPDCASQYCNTVIRGRWPEAEKSIMQDPESCALYSAKFLNSNWPEAEADILSRKKSNKTKQAIYAYLNIAIQKRWPEAEKAILQYPDLCVDYARTFIKGPWPEAEDVIKTSRSAAVLYATYIKGRWPEAEDVIKTSPKSAYDYARWVLETSWPEAEAVIKTSPRWWKSYCKHVARIDPNPTYTPEYSI